MDIVWIFLGIISAPKVGEESFQELEMEMLEEENLLQHNFSQAFKQNENLGIC